MRIFIDIGHPAHVHYFRNFIKIMQIKDHEFFISARDRSLIHYLLDFYGIAYYDRGKGKNSVIGKILYMFVADYKLLKQAMRFRPSIFLSFASPYAAQVAWLIRKPHIVLDDTEHAIFGQAFYKPFSTIFLNPFCFQKSFGSRQILFKSFTELFYLYPGYYKPNPKIFELLGLKEKEKFIFLRFISWNANHDIGQHGLSLDTIKQLIALLSDNNYRIFISTEGENKESFYDPYLIRIPPEYIHDVLYYAQLFISESGTMASEAAILGTPVVYVNSLPLMGYLREEQKHKILYHFPSSQGVIKKVEELISLSTLKDSIQTFKKELLSDKIDPTAFMVWFIEKFPESVNIMRENPDYQYIFK